VEIMKKLQEPFPPDDVEWRVDRVAKYNGEQYAYVLCYITNRAIMQRLDEVFGPMGWHNEFREWKGKGQLCGISVWDKEGEWWVMKWDGADDSQFEATKGGLSDSMKRAAVQWGIGRYLYKMEQQKVPVKTSGQNYVNAETKKGSNDWVKGYWDEPHLPPWALPPGYQYNKPANTPVASQDALQATKDESTTTPTPKCKKCGKGITKHLYDNGQMCVSCKNEKGVAV
jgi:hypothetical protein